MALTLPLQAHSAMTQLPCPVKLIGQRRLIPFGKAVPDHLAPPSCYSFPRVSVQQRTLAGRGTVQPQLLAPSAQPCPSAQGMHGAHSAKRAAIQDGANRSELDARIAHGHLALQEGSGLGGPNGAAASGDRGGGSGAPGAANRPGYSWEAGHRHGELQGHSHEEQELGQQQQEPRGRQSGRQPQFPCQEAQQEQEQQHADAPGRQGQGQGQRERPSSTGSGWRDMGAKGDPEVGRAGSGGGHGRRSSGGRSSNPGMGRDPRTQVAQAQPPPAGASDPAEFGEFFLHSQGTGGSHSASRAFGLQQQQQHGPVLDLGGVPPPVPRPQGGTTVSPPGGRAGSAAGGYGGSAAAARNAPALFNQRPAVVSLSAGGAGGGGSGGRGNGLPVPRDPRKWQHVADAALPAAAGGGPALGVGAGGVYGCAEWLQWM